MRFKDLSSKMKEQRRRFVLLLRFNTTQPNKESRKHFSYRKIS
jgi:hypothetical protein